METRVVKNYIYEGLGFPIVLENVTMVRISSQEWAPKIDVEKVAGKVMETMKNKSEFTGYEFFFIRSYRRQSKAEFAECFQVKEKTIDFWENHRDQVVPLDEYHFKLLKSLL